VTLSPEKKKKVKSNFAPLDESAQIGPSMPSISETANQFQGPFVAYPLVNQQFAMENHNL
jgi:hypothetical protein